MDYGYQAQGEGRGLGQVGGTLTASRAAAESARAQLEKAAIAQQMSSANQAPSDPVLTDVLLQHLSVHNERLDRALMQLGNLADRVFGQESSGVAGAGAPPPEPQAAVHRLTAVIERQLRCINELEHAITRLQRIA